MITAGKKGATVQTCNIISKAAQRQKIKNAVVKERIKFFMLDRF
jgi:hypothetical protein